jgi:hypothetical protein
LSLPEHRYFRGQRKERKVAENAKYFCLNTDIRVVRHKAECVSFIWEPVFSCARLANSGQPLDWFRVTGWTKFATNAFSVATFASPCLCVRCFALALGDGVVMAQVFQQRLGVAAEHDAF